MIRVQPDTDKRSYFKIYPNRLYFRLKKRKYSSMNASNNWSFMHSL